MSISNSETKHNRFYMEKTMDVAPIKAITTFDVIDQLDIRVGTIEQVLEVAKSDKLMKLVVNFGSMTRNILASIKQERSNPQELVGKQALFIVNLAPKKMAGEVSEGMLFDIGFSDGIKPVLAMPEVPVPNGARAG
jgi:methionine--tRNA ligase beta chain